MAEPTGEPTTKPTASEAPTQDADSLATTGSEGALGLLTLAAATLAGGLLLRGRRRRVESRGN